MVFAISPVIANAENSALTGRASLLDLIRHAITGKGERRVLGDLRKQHPEIESLIDTVRFPDGMGRTGANTASPVVDLEAWLQILPLLPGPPHG